MKTKLMALEALKKLDAYSSQFSHDQTGHKKLEFAREAIAALEADIANLGEPYGWQVQGLRDTFKGNHAELDAKAEAARVGGTAYAFPIYTTPQEPAAAGWMPIDTAPKDGTPIDIWRSSNGGERCAEMRRVDLGSGNVFYEPVHSGYSCVRDATHWMPLPAAPELLDELENCVDLLATCFPDAPVDSCIGVGIIKARAAIAKATGATL